MLLGRPGWDHLEGEELGGVKGEFCICAHPRVHGFTPAGRLSPGGGAYPTLPPPAPLEAASLLLDPSFTEERVQQAHGWAEVWRALLSSVGAS